MAKNCPECGALLNDNQIVCNECGYSFSVESEPQKDNIPNSVAGQPYVNGNMGQPYANGNMGQPYVNGNMGQPYANGNMGQPYANGNMGQPYVNGNMGQPYANGNMGQPYVNGNMGQPYVNGNMGQPYVNGNMGQPYANGNMGQPYVNGNMGQPYANGNMGQPYANGNMGQPYANGNMGQPYANGNMGQPYAKSEYETADVIEMWKFRVPYEKTVLSVFFKWLPRISGIVFFGMVLIAVLIFYKFTKLNSIEMVGSYTSTLEKLKLLIIVNAIGELFSLISIFKSEYIGLRCSAWLKSSNFDVITYYKSNNITMERVQGLCGDTADDCVKSIYFRYNDKAKIVLICSVILTLTIQIIATITLSVGFCQLFEGVLKNITLGLDIGIWKLFKDEVMVSLILVIGAGLVNVIVDSVLETKAESWLNKQLSPKE